LSSLTDLELDATADMARLRLGNEEREDLRAAIEQMLGYFDQMQAVDVAGVEPTTHPIATPDVAPTATAATAALPQVRRGGLRSDRSVTSAGRWQTADSKMLLRGAADTEEDFISMPNVL
jgi:aspartyl/glutamyl-tRNA(Asn/Gln) amidotransferase C subunit